MGWEMERGGGGTKRGGSEIAGERRNAAVSAFIAVVAAGDRQSTHSP